MSSATEPLITPEGNGPIPTFTDAYYLFGFAFGPDGTMYAAGGAELYNVGKMTTNDNIYPNGVPICDVGSYISDIEISPNFSNDQTIIIQTDGGVEISTDRGYRFTQTSLPVTTGYYDLAFSPNYASDGTIAAVVPDVGLFLSTDRGGSWKNVLPGKSITATAIGPSGAIYAGADYTYGAQDGVYVSFNKGQSWQNIGLEGSEISSLNVFKGTDGDQVYAATDKNLAWTNVTQSSSSTSEPVAPNGPTSVRFAIGQNSYTVDGSVYQTDAAPFIEDNHTYIPLRYLAHALGIGVVWDDASQTVTLTNSDDVLEMKIGVKQLTINGENAPLNYPPVIKDGRTYLPAQLLATYFNYNVSWDGQNQAVTISTTSF